MSRQKVLKSIVNDIEIEQNRKSKRPLVVLPKKSKDGPCKCLICGQILDILTHVHAEKHGYSCKQDLIKAGKVMFL